MCEDMMDCLKDVHKFAVRNLEDAVKEIKDNDDAIEFIDEPDTIEYEDVSFKYSENLCIGVSI